MTKANEIKKVDNVQLKEITNESIFNDIKLFGETYKMAQVISSSTMVPKHYQGSENIGNTLIAMDMSNRMGASLMFVMQNLYVIYGNPSWTSQFIIAQINQSRKFKKDLRFEYVGNEKDDSYGCYAWTFDQDGDKVKGSTITIKTAKDEGWFGKNGSKWKTMPSQMLMYRAATFFARVYAPEVLMGLRAEDEIIDTKGDFITAEEIELEKKENANKKELLINEDNDDEEKEQEQQSILNNVPF